MELPLGRHDFGIDSGDVDASKHTGLVMSLHDVAAENLAGSHTAIVWALWGRETSLGPAVWLVVLVEQGIFLLKTKPSLVLLVGLHQPCGIMAVVELVGASISVPALGHDQNVVPTAEWIWEDGARAEVDIGIVARGLFCG